jgi:hypothetical protein
MHLRALVTSLVILATTAELQAGTIDVGGGDVRTARAVRAGLRQWKKLDGHVWLGKLRGVGGGRDTLVYVPEAIDVTRTIDVVIYMDGVGSFDDAAIKSRHIASFARMHGNFVYVAPDAPSSSLGSRESRNEHWEAGCADRVCEGGYAAPGDFLVFLDEVRTKIAAMVRVERAALDVRVSLIGFSRGGKGVLRAVEQLAVAKFEVGGAPVRIADVVFADGNYLDNALAGTWAALESRPESPSLTILVESGEFVEGAENNRGRALAFWKQAAPAAPPPGDHETSAPRLRLIPLVGGHRAIGNAAVDFLGNAGPPAPTA